VKFLARERVGVARFQDDLSVVENGSEPTGDEVPDLLVRVAVYGKRCSRLDSPVFHARSLPAREIGEVDASGLLAVVAFRVAYAIHAVLHKSYRGI